MPPPSRRDEPLVRAIGTLALAAGIVNITIGGGIFRLPSIVAAPLGPAAPVAYVVCAAAMGLIVLCMADAGRRVPLTGGPYAYVGTAFGPYAGFVSGILLWMLGSFAGAAVTTVLAASVGLLVPALSGRMTPVTVVAVLLFWSLVNVRGVRLGARLNTIVTVAKLLPLLLLVVAGPFFVDTANLVWTSAPPAATVARTSFILIFAFAGIECALVPSGEVSDSQRSVPRAIAIAMIGVTVLYIALQVVAQGILGSRLATATTAPLADAAAISLGGAAQSLLLAGAAISMFGNVGGMILAMPRMVYAMARDGALPRGLAAVHPRVSLAIPGDCRAVGDHPRTRAVGHVRTARRVRQRVGAGALLRLRAGRVAAAPSRGSHRRPGILAACTARCRGWLAWSSRGSSPA